MIAAIVPAAGASTRLGQPKLLVKLDGQTVIERVVAALRDGGAERIVVVTPPADTEEGPTIAELSIRAGAEVVVPASRPREMRDSIEQGIHFLDSGRPARSVMLAPGDYPGITSRIVASIVESAHDWPDRIVVPTFAGRRGHPIVLPWRIAALVASLPADAGVNLLVARYAAEVMELALPFGQIMNDLDTPEDLERLEKAGGRFPVKVRLFAAAKDRAGRFELEVDLEHGSTVTDLRAAIGQLVPELGPLLETAMIAVNEEYAGNDVALAPGVRLALIPPVSGGARFPESSGRGSTFVFYP
jgi:molybdenum cofactor cytidylyltransferase